MKYKLVDADRDDFSALILLERKATELARLAQLLRSRREGEAQWAAEWINAARSNLTSMKALLDAVAGENIVYVLTAEPSAGETEKP